MTKLTKLYIFLLGAMCVYVPVKLKTSYGSSQTIAGGYRWIFNVNQRKSSLYVDGIDTERLFIQILALSAIFGFLYILSKRNS